MTAAWRPACSRFLIHGDASFAGQGVVAETLNLSQLEGYRVGGTMHLIINNQLGFTAESDATRSTRYSSDLGKAIEAPIFHVNGDDPEAAVRVAQIAEAYRVKFERDVIVDLISYRRRGHNEQDDPTYTQPLMYKLIDEHPTTRAIYAGRLIASGAISPEVEAADREALQPDARRRPGSGTPRCRVRTSTACLPGALPIVEPLSGPDAVSRTTLDAIAKRLHAWPDGFAIHPKMERQLLQRAEQYDAGEVDWALGEALAFGTLLLEGTPHPADRPGLRAGHVLAPPGGARRRHEREPVHPARIAWIRARRGRAGRGVCSIRGA